MCYTLVDWHVVKFSILMMMLVLMVLMVPTSGSRSPQTLATVPILERGQKVTAGNCGQADTYYLLRIHQTCSR